MSETAHETWDPRAPGVLKNQIAAYDELRQRTPVAHSAYLGWSVLTHAETMAVLTDHLTYSNEVSSHLNVPNGMDPPTHTGYREMVNRYFTPELVAAFEPRCREIAAELVAGLPDGAPARIAPEIGEQYALRVQGAYLGWSAEAEEPLRAWIKHNHEATLSGDRSRLAAVAQDFDDQIRVMLDARRAGRFDDLTARLLTEEVAGTPLTDEEIVSTLRNWTVGELGTIAASVGIMAAYLADYPDVQDYLREHPEDLERASDEILRMRAPLIANRRKTTCPVNLAGQEIDAGERVTLLWASANRDQAAFGDPDEFRLDRDPADNLLYGAGIHDCPGAGLARLELRVFFEELFAESRMVTPAGGTPRRWAPYPGSGYEELWLRVER